MADNLASFTRGLFAGEIHENLIFPFPPPLDDTNPEEARVVRRLITTIESRMDGLIDSEKFDEEETIGDDVIAALAHHGFLGLTIPKEYGGLELSPRGYARVFESVAATDASLGVFVGVHCGLGSKSIVLYGTDAQKEKWLPRLASGKSLAAYALTEPLVGSDAQHVKSQAKLSADGSTWTLNGDKLWIGLAHRAEVITTFAQTPVERNGKTVLRPTAFLVEPPVSGFRVVTTIRKMGIRGSTQAQLAYRDVSVPAANVLGEVGRGFTVAVNVLNAGRLSLHAGCTGGAKQLLHAMTIYAEQREQFGKPLADFEITQRKLATIAADTYASEAMLNVVSHLATENKNDWSIEAAIGKVFSSELIWRTADEMVQIAGGRGFVKPYPYERHLRDARINRIFEGANEILRIFVALNGIQESSDNLKEVAAALREPMRNWGILSEYVVDRVKSALGASATLDLDMHEVLKTHKSYFEKHVGEMKQAADKAVMQYKTELIERQLVVERLASMAIEMFATACVISRTQAAIEFRGIDACEAEIAACNLFCVESGRRFKEARRSLTNREDEVDTARREVAKQVRAVKGALGEDPVLQKQGHITPLA